MNRLEKRKGEENTIFSIYDEESSTIKSDSNEIKETIFNFYSKLYKRENEDITLQAEFLDKIDQYKDVYQNNIPFPHIRLENLFSTDLMEDVVENIYKNNHEKRRPL